VGTPIIEVACGSQPITASASNRGRRIIAPPAVSVTLIATNSPCEWKIGSACRSTSASVNRHVSVSARAFDRRFPCVSIAPFDRPVVPEV
jgi:hypothetical protein